MSRGFEVILDTHALTLLANDEFIEIIRRKCHTLVIPAVQSEIDVHQRSFYSMRQNLYIRLRGKYVEFERADKLPDDVKNDLRRCKCRARGKDQIIIGVAIRRQRITNRSAVIVSNDCAFHCLRSIKAVFVNEAIEFLNDC